MSKATRLGSPIALPRRRRPRRPAARPEEMKNTGFACATCAGDEAAIGVADEQRRGDAQRAKPVLEPRQIAPHAPAAHRHSPRSSRCARIRAARGSTATDAVTGDVREAQRGKSFGCAQFVGGIAVGIEEADRDSVSMLPRRRSAGSASPVRPRASGVDNAAVGGDALVDLEAIAARYQRLRLVPGQVEHAGRPQPPDLQHVAEAPSW